MTRGETASNVIRGMKEMAVSHTPLVGAFIPKAISFMVLMFAFFSRKENKLS
jgi:hypothetical protein